MIKFLFKISARNLIRYKTQSLIGVIGFVVAITATLFISIYVYQEYNYNTSLSDHSRIFRLEKINSVYFQGAVANIIKKRIPEVEYAVKLNPNNNPSISHIHSIETIKGRVFQTTAEWNNLFEPNILYGNIDEVLNTHDKIAIDQKTALSLFGNTDAIGQPVYLNHNFRKREKLTVGAVYENYPAISSMEPIGLYSLKSDEESNSREYDTYSIFIKLTDKNSHQKVLSQIHEVLVSENLLDKATSIQLTSLQNIYFSNYIENDFITRGSKKSVNTLILVGLVIVLISILNYQNFTIGLFEKKINSQRIHFALGANKQYPLVVSFIKSFIVCFVAGVTSLLLYLCYAKIFFFKWLDYNFGHIHMPKMLTLVMVISISIWVINNLFQLSISLIQTIATKRGDLRIIRAQSFTTITQLTATIILIICCLQIYKQQKHIYNHNSGLKTNNVITLHLNTSIRNKQDLLKQEFYSNPQIQDLCYASNDFTNIETLTSGTGRNKVKVAIWMIDENFLTFFGINISEGKGFNTNYSNDKYSCVINKAAFLSNRSIFRIGENIPGLWSKSTLIGVSDNFNYASLHNPIEPLCFILNKDYCTTAFIKYNGSTASVLKHLKSKLNDICPEIPFEYSFLQDTIHNFYKVEERLLKILSLLCGITIVLNCVGLWSLFKVIVNNRTKEIGIRKVNGAKVGEILTLLNRDFVKWVIIAFVIATPIAYYAMDKWLENFAYKTELSWWIFALAGVVALGIALLTVSFQSWKAATRNPVEALRYE